MLSNRFYLFLELYPLLYPINTMHKDVDGLIIVLIQLLNCDSTKVDIFHYLRDIEKNGVF